MTWTLSFGSTLALDVVLTSVHVLALSLTAFRVYYRTVTRRLWWDDLVALLALLGDIAYISALWFGYARKGARSMFMAVGTNLMDFDRTGILHEHKGLVFRYWFGLMLFLVVVWMTRISIALAIARIFPPNEPTRRFAISLAILSMIFCLVVITQSAVVCKDQPALVSGPNVACQWPNSLRILVVVANIFSDSLLVATPLYKLWRVRLPRNKRRLILSGFTASALTTTATVACAVFQFAPENLEPGKSVLRGKLSYLETGISLIACNLLVVITYFYMHFRRGEDIELTEDTSETCDSAAGTINHSNLMPPSVFTPYTMTEISEISVFEQTGCEHGSSPSSSTTQSSSEYPSSFPPSTQ